MFKQSAAFLRITKRFDILDEDSGVPAGFFDTVIEEDNPKVQDTLPTGMPTVPIFIS